MPWPLSFHPLISCCFFPVTYISRQSLGVRSPGHERTRRVENEPGEGRGRVASTTLPTQKPIFPMSLQLRICWHPFP